MDEHDVQFIRGELRKLRDGVEVIAMCATLVTMMLITMSGLIFPRPEGWSLVVAIGVSLFVAGTIGSGIRNR